MNSTHAHAFQDEFYLFPRGFLENYPSIFNRSADSKGGVCFFINLKTYHDEGQIVFNPARNFQRLRNFLQLIKSATRKKKGSNFHYANIAISLRISCLVHFVTHFYYSKVKSIRRTKWWKVNCKSMINLLLPIVNLLHYIDVINRREIILCCVHENTISHYQGKYDNIFGKNLVIPIIPTFNCILPW